MNIRKASDEFFERIVSILPIHIQHLGKEDLVRVLEVLVKRDLGSDRLYYNYLLYQIEKRSKKLKPTQYARIILSLADKQFIEDPVFWSDYMTPYVRNREFTPEEAKKIWDALIYLKLKCPTLDIKEMIATVESFLEDEPYEEE